MSWKEQEKERQRVIDEERKRLLAMTDGEAESLPVPDRYQRIRYLREIEAAEWLANLRRTLPAAPTEQLKPMRSRYGKKVAWNKFSD